MVIRTRIFVRKLVLPALLFIGILSSTVLDKVLTDQHKCAGARLGTATLGARLEAPRNKKRYAGLGEQIRAKAP